MKWNLLVVIIVMAILKLTLGGPIPVYALSKAEMEGFDQPPESTLLVFAFLAVLAVLIVNIILRWRAEERLRQSEAMFRRFVEHANDIIYYLDSRGIFKYVSPNWTDFLGHSPDEVIGRSYLNFIHPDDAARYQNIVDDPPPSGEKLSLLEYRIQHKNGEWRWHISNGSILGGEKQDTFFIGISRDITEHKTAQERLEYLNIHDAMTGLFNRGFFEQELKRVVEQGTHPVSMIVCDVDGLKMVNDSLGHPAGDHVLREAAHIIQSNFRECDLVARMGGDEFAVVLPGAEEQVAEHACQRIKECLRHYRRSEGFPLSISCGYATYHNLPINTLELYAAADRAMYADKLNNSQRIQDLVQYITRVRS